MTILVINTGSTSIKFQCFDTDSWRELCRGSIADIGAAMTAVSCQVPGRPALKERRRVPDAEAGIRIMLDLLTSREGGVLRSLQELQAIGHRVVHGGAEISCAVRVSPELERLIEKYAQLAPLHNPANLQGIRILKELLPDAKQAAVFDTAFHASLPEESYLFGLSYECYAKHGIRRFGFHGPSHQYVFQRAAAMLGVAPQACNAVTCHMGGGISLAAIRGGVSVDTSLGFGTVAGVPMGTRCGDVDPAAILHLIEELGLSAAEVHRLLYEESGLLGLSGISADVRKVLAAAAQGTARARLALQVVAHAARRHVAGLAAALGGRLTAVVFTAGIGESCPELRQLICDGLEVLGLALDSERNNGAVGREAVISRADSRVAALVVPTNEELAIAQQTAAIV